ncbi:glycerate kinase [Acinetobacter gandensis]|uniref:Glycerate kinase n=1 Tax=Acinetobacter gandensis TaxID=1443941 RepID=A0A1A7R910_9GAMM|nr:glycerate kinase [Acinetobacter gandensis]KAB0627634.1 glycerate kinase [Acinetobacter gandensis]OBX28750.1 glycerate kinase [Acinetobacter gandensis]
MTTFVLAPDSFKESMSAQQACDAMQRAILKLIPDANVIAVPMADGGEGTVDALLSACHGEKVAIALTGPLPNQRVTTYFGLIDGGQTAVIEMAKANGIHLVDIAQRNPLLTSTYGTGEMILAALDVGVSKIIIGLGGSMTNDGGAGMAQALGAQFLDENGLEVAVCGGCLDQIKSLDLTQLDSRLTHTEIIIASDVINPLCGENGASYIFGPQKGATQEMVCQLDQKLSHYADVVEATLDCALRDAAGAGAAGGLGFGLMAFAGASMRSGVELVIEQSQLKEKIAQADFVLTGEGKIDYQTKFGKTPFGVAQVAKKYNKSVIAFTGLVGEEIAELYDLGFTQIVGINPPDCKLEDALKYAELNLEHCCRNVMRCLK